MADPANKFEAESIFGCADIERLHPRQRHSPGFQYNKKNFNGMKENGIRDEMDE